jgi:hypothetical protein
MKINEKVMEIHGNMNFDASTRMTFDSASIAHIIRSLTNMYSDPYAAIAREYAGNAYDSHIMANQSKPIEITTPTDLNSSFIVRDFGIGMSRTELVDIYSKYGASTKRDTNNQIGAFGLGAKSALALVSSFTVLSVKDGKKNTVIVSKDETGVGALNFFEEQNTDAENGVTITIPVPKAHLMRTAVAGLFLGWPQGMVKVDGVLIEDTVHNPEFFTPIDEAGYLIVSKNEKANRYYYSDNLPVKALVGPVSYEIKKELFIDIISKTGSNLWDDKGKIRLAALKNLVLRLPNGSVDLTPSRETLIFNSRTKKAIVEAFEAMEKGISKHLNDKLTQAKDRKEALTLSTRFISQGFMVPTTWNGETIPLEGSTIAKEEEKETVIVTHSKVLAGSPSSHRKIAPNVEVPEKSKSIHFVPFRKVEPAKIHVSSEYDGISKRIIITEAILPENAGEKDYHTVASNLAAYLKVANPTQGSHPVEFFSTSLKETELNPWAIATADQILTAEEVMEVVRKKRREDSAARKLNNIANGPVVPVETKISIASRVKNSSNNGVSTYKIKTVLLEDMPKDSKYVVLRTSSAKKKEFKTLEEALYNYLRGWNAYGTYLGTPYTESFLASVTELITSSGYVLVAIPDNRANTKLLASLTNKVEFKGLTEKLILDTFASLNEVEKEWIKGIKLNSKHAKWITSGYNKIDYSGVESKETREWIALATSKRGRILSSLFGLAFGVVFHKVTSEATPEDKFETDYYKRTFERNVQTSTAAIRLQWGTNIEVANKFLDLLFSPVKKEIRNYPLLHNLYSCDNTEAIIEYINFKDSTVKA